MNKYTASNGVQIVPTNAGNTFHSPGDSWPNPEPHDVFANADVVTALREFFLHKAGIWVDEPTGALVVLNRAPLDDRYVSVFVDGLMFGVYESGSRGSSPQALAAQRFFDAHLERKPWDDAKPGEAWRLREVDAYPGIAIFTELHVWLWSTGSAVDLNRIVEGHRIWPESD